MALEQTCKRASLSIAAALTFAGLGAAHEATLQNFDDANDGSLGAGALGVGHGVVAGSASGTVDMPSLSQPGILVAVGQSQDGGVYMVDCELSSAIPGLFDASHRVAFGGLYGELLEVPQGGLGSNTDTFAGMIDGIWTMDKSLVGSYDALVYARQADGSMALAGRIHGGFSVQLVEDAVPGPVVDGQREKSKPAIDAFDDARGRRSPLGDAQSAAGRDKPLDASRLAARPRRKASSDAGSAFDGARARRRQSSLGDAASAPGQALGDAGPAPKRKQIVGTCGTDTGLLGSAAASAWSSASDQPLVAAQASKKSALVNDGPDYAGATKLVFKVVD